MSRVYGLRSRRPEPPPLQCGTALPQQIGRATVRANNQDFPHSDSVVGAPRTSSTTSSRNSSGSDGRCSATCTLSRGEIALRLLVTFGSGTSGVTKLANRLGMKRDAVILHLDCHLRDALAQPDQLCSNLLLQEFSIVFGPAVIVHFRRRVAEQLLKGSYCIDGNGPFDLFFGICFYRYTQYFL